MATIKAYLYCTNAKPYLTKVVELGRYYAVGKKDMKTLGYKTEGELKEASLNGTVCFECEIEKAEKIVIAPFPFANGDYQYASKTLTPDALEVRSCLSVKELNDYDPRHALYLKNVKEIKPFKITKLWKYKAHPFGPYHLSRAPQNMCWAWRWNDNGLERVLVLSLRPKNLCNIANGLKDIETRRKVVKEIKEMEK